MIVNGKRERPRAIERKVEDTLRELGGAMPGWRQGLSDYLATTLVARADQTVIGSAALEPYGAAALLRSVAVDQAFRGQGLGQRLTQAALARCHWNRWNRAGLGTLQAGLPA